jgi:hypothetical protein
MENRSYLDNDVLFRLCTLFRLQKCRLIQDSCSDDAISLATRVVFLAECENV